jgi:hypothetical protein
MTEFDDLEKKARAYAEEHPEQSGQGVDQVPGFAERDTDLQHDEQVDRALGTAEEQAGQEQPGDQD